jgi:glycosyltransferase involved in cell wall biosynthesis
LPVSVPARILLIVGTSDRQRSELGLFNAFRADYRFHVREVASVAEAAAAIQDRDGEYDAVVVFLKFADVKVALPLDWGSFDGLRVLYDHDALWNYSAFGSLQGEWPKAVRRHGFQLVVCTGMRTAQLLVEDGIDAAWVPKGYDPEFFFDRHRARDGICTFGARYPARAAMRSYLRASGRAVVEIQLPYGELNDRLNDFAACVVCNLDGDYKFGALGRRAATWREGLLARALVRPLPGLEVMIKNYEASAAGCAVFCDSMPELERLGFVDGETVISYGDFDELAAKMDEYAASPASLRRIGERGAALCVTRHTWAHRVEEIHTLLQQRVNRCS